MDEILRIVMLAAVLVCGVHSIAKSAIKDTREAYQSLDAKAKRGVRPHWNASQWRKYYYIRSIVLAVLLLALIIRVAFLPGLALMVIALAILFYLNHFMIICFQASVTALYDNHRTGKMRKWKHLHLSVYPHAFWYVIPATVLGTVIIFTINVLIIYLFAYVASH